jgi:hypothetical protein
MYVYASIQVDQQEEFIFIIWEERMLFALLPAPSKIVDAE